MSTEHPMYTKLKTAMLVHVPFFCSLLFDLMEVKVGTFPDIFGDRTPTAATDGKNVWIDEKFLSKLKLPEAVFLICHEIGHTIWAHMSRGKYYQDMGFEGQQFNPRIWNCAGDYVINDMLKKSQIGEMPKGGLHDPKYTHDMVVEDVYRDLMKDPPEDEDSIDLHILHGQHINDAQLKRSVQSAVDAAKAMGKLPGALERFAGELLSPKVKWQEKLRYFVARAISRDSTTWSRPHRRRLITQGVYLAAYTGFGAGDVVVVIDTSGSVGDHDLAQFLGEVDDILTTCNPTSVTLIGCDAAINTVHHLEAGDSLKGNPPKLGGGGGTDFHPPFKWVEENIEPPAALIYFTDMYGSFPDSAPGYPVIWCRTTDQMPPWGEEIKVDLTTEKQ